MSRGRIKAILFIIVFLLVAAVIVSWLSGRDKVQKDPDPVDVTVVGDALIRGEEQGQSQGQSQSAEPAASQAPAQQPASTEPTPIPVATPSPTPAPTPTPDPNATPEPTPTPEPANVSSGVELGSGSFSSNTGTGLDLRADWVATANGGSQATVKVTVSVDSYSLHLSGTQGAVNLSLGEQYASIDEAQLQYDGRARVNTVFGTHSFTVTLGSDGSLSLPLAVEWHFGGKYGGTSLDVLECGGNVKLGQ